MPRSSQFAPATVSVIEPPKRIPSRRNRERNSMGPSHFTLQNASPRNYLLNLGMPSNIMSIPPATTIPNNKSCALCILSLRIKYSKNVPNNEKKNAAIAAAASVFICARRLVNSRIATPETNPIRKRIAGLVSKKRLSTIVVVFSFPNATKNMNTTYGRAAPTQRHPAPFDLLSCRWSSNPILAI